jgi:hypothetical protein
MSETMAQQYRVWITTYEEWRPQGWRDVPPACIALEPAEEHTFTAEEAAAYVESYNQATIAQGRNRWAVAVPVTIDYEGDLSPGEVLDASRLGRVVIGMAPMEVG